MSDSLTIEIDGTAYSAAKGEMLIAVADRNGVRIPRFCYHEKLSVAANCRMCLVEVERAPKPLPACATPVMDGMKVHTRSELARNAQKSVMEFLLINHPLDCPICDQGGECELQDVAMGYGRDASRFVERKRVVKDEDLGPLIATDMTRCIHCTRCVRFGEEIAGVPELGLTGRGEHVKIGTFIRKSVDSELSGNVIDVCPVGALTNKPFRFRARTWEMRQHASVSPHDAVGSNLNLHVARNQVMRVVPRENEAVNQVWIADRDRFSHTGLYSEDRLLQPMIRRGEQWHSVAWDEALEFAADGLRDASADNGDAIAALTSSSATCEELYLLQKLMRGLGSNNIDHRLRQHDFSDQHVFPSAPGLATPLAALSDMDAVLLVGSNVRKEYPLVNHRLRLAARAGAAVMTLNATDYQLNYPLAHSTVAAPRDFADTLSAMASEVSSDSVRERLASAERAVILLGPTALNHPQANAMRVAAAALANATGAELGFLTDGGNAAGAWLAGCVPHRGAGARELPSAGRHALELMDSPPRAMVLFAIEPELDLSAGARACDQLARVDHLVAFTAFDSPRLRDVATVMLPIGLFPETAGTYVNLEGRWQTVTGALKPPAEARPAWRVLRVLGNQLDLPGFDFMDVSEVLQELQTAAANVRVGANGDWHALGVPVVGGDVLERVAEVPIYAVDALVRRAAPLQATSDGRFQGIHLGPGLARKLGVADGDAVRVRQNATELTLTARIDSAIADGCVRLACAVPETVSLGPVSAPIEVFPVTTTTRP